MPRAPKAQLQHLNKDSYDISAYTTLPDTGRGIALIQTDLPLIPVAWYRQSIAVSNDVAGAFIDPFERT